MLELKNIDIQSGAGGVAIPVFYVMWQQLLQVQSLHQSAKCKFVYFEIDYFVPQLVGQNHTYSIDEIVGASSAVIE